MMLSFHGKYTTADILDDHIKQNEYRGKHGMLIITGCLLFSFPNSDLMASLCVTLVVRFTNLMTQTYILLTALSIEAMYLHRSR